MEVQFASKILESRLRLSHMVSADVDRLLCLCPSFQTEEEYLTLISWALPSYQREVPGVGARRKMCPTEPTAVPAGQVTADLIDDRWVLIIMNLVPHSPIWLFWWDHAFQVACLLCRGFISVAEGDRARYRIGSLRNSKSILEQNISEASPILSCITTPVQGPHFQKEKKWDSWVTALPPGLWTTCTASTRWSTSLRSFSPSLWVIKISFVDLVTWKEFGCPSRPQDLVTFLSNCLSLSSCQFSGFRY